MIRTRLSPSARRSILERQGGACHDCGEMRHPETFEDDHAIPLWLGGTNDLSNRVLRCVTCHAKKTAKEARSRAKIERTRDTEVHGRKRSKKERALERMEANRIAPLAERQE